MYVVPDLGVGGAERHVTTLMPNLDRAKFDGAVVCIGAEGKLFADLAHTGIPAVALHRSKREALGAISDLVREMRKFAPDIILTRGYNAEMLGRIAARIARVPHSVVWVHNCGDTEPRGRVRTLADRLLDRRTSAYFGVAKAQLSYMVEDLGYDENKITIIYNGVEPERFDPTDDRSAVADLGIGESDRVVGILAALRPEKDHANFLHAARAVADAVPNAKFLIIGDGPMRPEIEELRAELNLADRAILTGSRSDVAQLLRAIDVFVLSSYSVECFPMALLEAMASGRPAVCTAVGGVPEMITEGTTGHLVPAHDSAALADRLVPILSDQALRQRMGAAARARVEEEFSLRVSVRAAEKAMSAVVGVNPELGRPVRLTVVLDLTFVGGAEVLLLNLFKNFDPNVVVPRLICLREAGDLAAEFTAAGFDVEVLDRTGKFDTKTLPRLVRSLRGDKTDVLLVTHHHRAALALGRLAAKAARVPVNIVAAHDMDLTSVGKRVFPKWAVNSFRYSDALVLLSPSQGEYLHREEGVGRNARTSAREVVIPNGIELPPAATAEDRQRARLHLGVAEDDFVVGIVARLSAQKAHQVLFQAVAACSAAVPQLRLVVIGGGEREAELRELAEELGIAGRTSFLGIRRDVPALLPGFDVACLSSVHEGVPITLIEAMAAAVPIVATDCGSIRDIVGEGEQGYVVPVGDVKQFADRLTTLATDESLRTQLGKNGRARVEREFQIEQTAKAYEQLLTDLVVGKQ
ncbi:glycosyltransferase [Antrihabitans sp. YC2-6]|nr:glycosyltransferase [Antrihabitans sp. YC2-6]